MNKFIYTIRQFIWAIRVQSLFIVRLMREIPYNWPVTVGPKARIVGITVCYIMAFCLLPLQAIWIVVLATISVFSEKMKTMLFAMSVANAADNVTR